MDLQEDLRFLVSELRRERDEVGDLPASSSIASAMSSAASAGEQELFDVFRALVNVRPPAPLAPAAASAQDRVLQELIARAGITDVDDIVPCQADPRLALWQGDITTLAVGAIVNAANTQGLGCWVPGHFCIDNAIHTFAGTQLRLACARELEDRAVRGLPDFVVPGTAMITDGFNLPADYVIHTVGPVVAGDQPSPQDEETLSACYESSLDLASEAQAESIAFCCISTGVFGYPQKSAARVAVDAVKRWLAFHPSACLRVVFDVFSDADLHIYQELLA